MGTCEKMTRMRNRDKKGGTRTVRKELSRSDTGQHLSHYLCQQRRKKTKEENHCDGVAARHKGSERTLVSILCAFHCAIYLCHEQKRNDKHEETAVDVL